MASSTATRCRTACLLLAGILSGLCACSRDRAITSYRIPKEEEEAQAPAADSAAPSGPAGIRWTVPSGWQQQPASGMRQGSFRVPDAGGAAADVSVVSFPGTGGDDLANINRWRSQLNLPAVAPADLTGQLQGMTAAAGSFVIADLAGTAGEEGAARILGAWLRQPDRVWFFKMMGPARVVGAQRGAFTAFLQSVNFANRAAGEPALLAQNDSSQANTNDLPPASAGPAPLPAQAARAIPMDSVPVRTEQGASLLWTAPADWRTGPGNAMRRGSYSADGAEVAITAFPGDVGGSLANVNRWRGQAGLAEVDEAGLGQVTTALESNGLHFLVADASGGASPIVAALVPWNGGTWFFKLTGPAEAVARAKPAFISFLRTVRTP
jgi:hypothetical protein